MNFNFTYKQGAELFVLCVILPLILLLALGVIQLPPAINLDTADKVVRNPSPVYVTQPESSVPFPPGNVTTDQLVNAWYEWCTPTGCTRGWWLGAEGFKTADEAIISDISGYVIYPMLNETQLVQGVTYSICDMPKSALWMHRTNAEEGERVNGCVVGIFDNAVVNYYFTVNGEQVWFPWVSDNVFPYVFQITR